MLVTRFLQLKLRDIFKITVLWNKWSRENKYENGACIQVDDANNRQGYGRAHYRYLQILALNPFSMQFSLPHATESLFSLRQQLNRACRISYSILS
jgi:hypothetical protein